MKHTLTVARYILKSVRRAVSLRSALTALLLAPLTALHAGRPLPKVPRFGKFRVSSFQPLENRDAMTSNVWK